MDGKASADSADSADSSSPAPPSMSMFYPMEREDSGGALGLEESDEHDLGTEAFADMAMGGMDMSLELNALQIRAFLARNEAASESGGLSGNSTGQIQERRSGEETRRTQGQESTPSAYEVLRNGAVHYSRREDKMKALQEHPVVAAVAEDGRTVACKCGRSVRLNPPWYILKFEQHVASRNCSFLRQSSKKKRKRVETNEETQRTTRSAGAESSGFDTGAANAASAGSEQRDYRITGAQRTTATGEEGVRVDRSRSVDGSAQQVENGYGAEVTNGDGMQGQVQSTPDAAVEADVEGDDSDVGSDEYSLQSVDAILRREFGVVEHGRRTIVAPAANAPDKRVRMYKGAMALRSNPHFTRVTPDGRFVECKCSRIVLLSAPWQPGQFLMHVADKKKPKKRANTSSAVVTGGQWKKKRTLASGISPSSAAMNLASSGAVMRPTNSTNALLHVQRSKRSFPREIRWDVARCRGLLPCPSLRDERMNTFVASAVQLTGGARQRQKIARELFPHLFSDSTEYDHSDVTDKEGETERTSSQSSVKKKTKLHQQLLEAEKLLLHDVIECEALWFVDKDGNSVRSLDCLGVIDAGKGEERCSACTALRSNAALRSAATTQYKIATRPGPPPNPINRKFCSGRVCSLLESEFDMRELHSRLLRDLALTDISSGSPLNIWMEMATMGLSGDFNTHPSLLGVTEAMVRLKDKEQRGVGLQNMSYSEHLDTFMLSLSDLSPEACELFQKHLGGRKQRQLLAATSKTVLPTKRRLPHTADNSNGEDASTTDQEQRSDDALNDNGRSNTGAVSRATNEDGFVHLLDSSVVGLNMPPLSIGDIQDVDLSTFPTSSGMQHQAHDSNDDPHGDSTLKSSASPAGKDSTAQSQQLSHEDPKNRDDVAAVKATESDPGSETNAPSGKQDNVGANCEAGINNNEAGDEVHMEHDPGAVAFLTDLTTSEDIPSKANESTAGMPTNHVPCTGLRDENVQAYVANAVQLVGGSRPRYVIARELFPRVFGNDKKVRIVDKLNSEQRLVLQDAVFSECLWRVDKEGRCVRSLRCKRFVSVSDKEGRTTPQNQGVCRACRDLRTVPNFRSVLSRSKVPKKLENIKYVPSVYTESDPFLRKLSKNSAFRGLYQIVKRLTSSKSNDGIEGDAERQRQVCFWLRFARMGVFGHFHSHPVFEGLMKSMVEIKDKERRGVGKQNMQYSRALDAFMQAMTQISTEAFELFAAQFCGRTLRSQKVKRKSASQTLHASAQSTAIQEQTPVGIASAAQNAVEDPATHQPDPPPASLSSHPNQHYLMQPDNLLGGRSLSTEESQLFVDRMMIEFSASRHIELEEERRRGLGNTGDIAMSSSGEETHLNEDDSTRLGPETYLNDEGVLTTEI